MAFLTLEGIYKDGKIELAERPGQVESPARVLVTFLPREDDPAKVVDRESLRRQAFARMKEGMHLGGPPYTGREE